MITKFIVSALSAVLLGSCVASAAEPMGAGPEEVAKAYIAARDVGNVDAAVAFFSNDGFFQLAGGKKFANRDELRQLHELFAHEHVHSADLRTVTVKDNTVVMYNNVSTVWLTKFGFAGMPVYEIMRMDWQPYHVAGSAIIQYRLCSRWSKPAVKKARGDGSDAPVKAAEVSAIAARAYRTSDQRGHRGKGSEHGETDSHDTAQPALTRRTQMGSHWINALASEMQWRAAASLPWCVHQAICYSARDNLHRAIHAGRL